MSGEEHDYERLIAPIRSRMISSIWHVTHHGECAEDALQEALVTIWRRLDRIRRHPNPHALILRICIFAAHNQLRRFLRRAKQEQPLPDDGHYADPAVSAAQRLTSEEEESAIRLAMSRLPRNQATAVLMRIVEERPYNEIAETLGCSEATVRTHVKRGRERLRQLLAGLRAT